MSHYSIVVLVWLMLGVLGAGIELWAVLHDRHDRSFDIRLVAEHRPDLVLLFIVIGVLGGPIQLGILAGGYYRRKPGQTSRGRVRTPPRPPVVCGYQYEPATPDSTCECPDPKAYQEAIDVVSIAQPMDTASLPRCGKPAVVVLVLSCTDGSKMRENTCETCHTTRIPIPRRS